jgi:hypothetical protein
MKTLIVTSKFGLCGVVAATAMSLHAQAPPDRERAAIAFGAFITDPATEVSVGNDSGNGTDIDMEDDLGLERSTTVLRLGGHLWLSERNRLDFSLFSFSREGTRRIDETIEFGDEIFAINTVVTSQADLDVAKAAYTFAPIVKERGYLGLTAGLYVSQTMLSLSAATLNRSEERDLTAPLPVIGIRGDYALSDRFTLRGAVEWFGIDTGDVEGTLLDRYVAVDYGFGRRFAVGVAYNDVSMDIDADEGTGGFRGALDWGYDGWLVYMNVNLGNR